MTSLVVLVTVFHLAWSFNLEPRHADVLDYPDSAKGSYFGYALAFWRQSHNGVNITWLLVGSPRAEEATLKGERVRQPGAVFKCRLDDVTATPRCSRIAILGDDYRREQHLTWRWNKIIPKQAWLGATVTVENELNGTVVVCAPRMMQMVHPDVWFIPGICYYWKSDDKILPLSPYLKTDLDLGRGPINGFINGLAQVGISAHFVENSTKSQLVLGATGVSYFQGAMSMYEQDYSFIEKLPTLHAPRFSSQHLDSYLGYSVTSAKLHSDGRVSYIAGAPRDKGLDLFTGAIYVMSGANQMNWLLETKLDGGQMGEYFGACVMTLDLNLDGIDDLVLVGAPLHSLRQSSMTDSGEQGRLYVYKNVGEGRLEPMSAVLTGSSVPGARFASSVTSLGDLNKDGFTDVAVGAPYEGEEGQGAVYIYLGGKHGLSGSYSQRIAATEIRHDLRGFGISLASDIDLDGNSFNDLAIGSYESGNVVIVKSYPTVQLEGSLQPVVSNLDVNVKDLVLKACLAYSMNSRPDLLLNIDVTAVIKADLTWKRAVFESSHQVQETTVHLQRDVMRCWDIHVSFKPILFHKMQPVEFSMEYRVADHLNKDQKFCKLCPVTDPLKPSAVHIKIPFANGCGGKSVCLADLKVEVQSSNKGQAIVLGRNTKISLKVSIINTKEPAYLVKMALILPKSTSLLKMPRHCYLEEGGTQDYSDNDMIMCGLGNILKTDQTTKNIKERTTKFEIDVSGVGFDTSVLTFNITAWGESEEQTPNDNSVIIDIPVKLISEVAINGNTMQKHVILSSKDENQPSIPVFHIYEITNLGPSVVGELTVSLSLPTGLIIDDGFGMITFAEVISPELTIKGHTIRCTVDYNAPNIAVESRRKRDIAAIDTNTTEVYLRRNTLSLNCSESGGRRVICRMVTCVAGSLASGDTAEVKLHFNINRTMLDLIQNKDIIQISSTGLVEMPKTYEIPSGIRLKLNHVATLVVGDFEETVSPWILLLSTILGLFVLSLMVNILSKAGFFRRKYKENIETMRDARQEFAYQKILPHVENNIFY